MILRYNLSLYNLMNKIFILYHSHTILNKGFKTREFKLEEFLNFFYWLCYDWSLYENFHNNKVYT